LKYIHDVTVADVRGKFEMKTQVSKVAKSVLLFIRNPGYADILSQNHHLRGVKMDNEDTKAELPIHLILGAGDYSRIKTTTKPKLGQPGQPIAELAFLERKSISAMFILPNRLLQTMKSCVPWMFWVSRTAWNRISSSFIRNSKSN
jgi:hypothetical protein